jgi:uncharacterized coiled-coil DUF342 family protein
LKNQVKSYHDEADELNWEVVQYQDCTRQNESQLLSIDQKLAEYKGEKSQLEMKLAKQRPRLSGIMSMVLS